MSGFTKFISIRQSVLREFSKSSFVRIYSRSKTNNIEALRRKYEALLQEDKKRKERNDYILEKMDNMRSCNALTSIKHRSFIQGNTSGLLTSSNNLAALGASASPEVQFYQNFHQGVPGLPSNDGFAVSLLRDIYNKYILIPKRLPDEQENPQQCYGSNKTMATAPVPTNIEINSDWKSKYEILNKIKQDEKESTGNDSPEFDNSIRQQKFACANQQLEQEIPEKDNSNTIKLNYENDCNKHCDNHTEKRTSLKQLRSPNLMAASEINSDRNIKEIASDSADTDPYPFTKIEGSEKIEHLDDEGINPAHISYPPENIGKPFGDVPESTEDVQYPLDVISVEDFTPKPNIVVQDGVNVNPKEYGLNKDHFKPLYREENEKDVVENDKGTVHVDKEEYDTSHKHFQTVLSHEVDDDKPDNTATSKTEKPENPEMALASEEVNDTQNIHSTHMSYSTDQTVPLPEHVEDLGNASVEIGNTFGEDEQAMFYPESLSEVTYDPTASAEETWDNTQNENIQPSEQYYYEGPHEMPESVHINEHEETNTPYDQNYEQQYDVANYGQQEYNETQQYLPQVGYGEPAGLQSQQVYAESGQAVYDQSGQVVYDQSEHAVYEQQPMEQYNPEPEYQEQLFHQETYEQKDHIEDQVVYDQSKQAVYEQQPMEQYNPEPEYQEQLFHQNTYEQKDHIEDQLNQEEGYVVPPNEQVEALKMENLQESPVIIKP